MVDRVDVTRISDGCKHCGALDVPHGDVWQDDMMQLLSKNELALPQNVQGTVNIAPSHSTPKGRPPKTDSVRPGKNLCKDASFIMSKCADNTGISVGL